MPVAAALEFLSHRRPSHGGSTIADVTLNGKHYCYTCEDEIREPSEKSAAANVLAWKVPGQTAIPAGRYRIIVTYSDRFKRLLPLLLDVPGYTGIRIHPGNTQKDTAGCLCPGETQSNDQVYESAAACDTWMDDISDALMSGREVWITIANP